ncbi:MAG TPA: DUF3570 domain-containing protein [Steroidobacteraceae bacterium]|nr:DUF3570 domain-containing protein [Steroidobacteraceae bacterium]
MQLTRSKLFAASCTLLGVPAVHADQSDWSADSALTYYHESDGRITAVEPVVKLKGGFGNERTLDVKLTYDSLSGATPNGAIPSTRTQTFASPSGTSLNPVVQTYTTASGQSISERSTVYSIAPGQLPMDPNYSDQRFAINANWQQPLSRLTHLSVGGDLSYEHDFLSTSLNTTLSHDFNQKNTTLSLAVNGEYDSVQPIGGAPVAGSDYSRFQKNGDESKLDVNVMLGLTQIMTRRWIADVNISSDRMTGYLNDPYKIISIVDDTGNVTGYLYEKRPQSRTRNSIFWENHIALDDSTISTSVRHMTDNWGIHSDTLQLNWRLFNGDHDGYIEPQLRWYRQSAANFYVPWLSNNISYVDAASADSRLGALHALTFGLKYAFKTRGDFDSPSKGNEYAIRAEFYQQTPDQKMPGPGVLQGLNLYPGLKAFLIQFEWKFSN